MFTGIGVGPISGLFFGTSLLCTSKLAKTYDLPRIVFHARPSGSFEAGDEPTQSAQMEERSLSTPFSGIPCIHFNLRKQHMKRAVEERPAKLIFGGQEITKLRGSGKQRLCVLSLELGFFLFFDLLACDAKEDAILSVAIQGQASSAQGFGCLTQYGLGLRCAAKDCLDAIWKALRIYGGTKEN